MRTIIALAICLLALGVPAADAHAFLDRAQPRVGSSVASAPREVTLWFTQNLEPAFCGASVKDSSGARVDQGKAHVDPGSPNVLRLSLKPLSPGSYTVYWQVLSVDTHTTEGTFSFRVGTP